MSPPCHPREAPCLCVPTLSHEDSTSYVVQFSFFLLAHEEVSYSPHTSTRVYQCPWYPCQLLRDGAVLVCHPLPARRLHRDAVMWESGSSEDLACSLHHCSPSPLLISLTTPTPAPLVLLPTSQDPISVIYTLACPAFTPFHLPLSTKSLGPISAENLLSQQLSCPSAHSWGSSEHYLVLQAPPQTPTHPAALFPLFPACPSHLCVPSNVWGTQETTHRSTRNPAA